MEVVKKTDDYTIYKKKSGRYGVQAANKKWINGDEKVRILLEAGLIKAATPKPQEPEVATEETVEAASEEATETPQEEASAPAAE